MPFFLFELALQDSTYDLTTTPAVKKNCPKWSKHKIPEGLGIAVTKSLAR
jgi:hypothetical protein